MMMCRGVLAVDLVSAERLSSPAPPSPLLPLPQAIVDVSASGGWLGTTLNTIKLIQCIMQVRGVLTGDLRCHASQCSVNVQNDVSMASH